jgi:squalene-hopene/tetraprenyl-beta-curcumene cyclase
MWAEVGLIPWESIRRLPLEVVLLPKQIRRTVSTTFPAFLSLSILHDRHLRYILPRRVVRRLIRHWAGHWLRRAQPSHGGFEESAFLTALVGLCLRGSTEHTVALRCEQYVLASQREDGSWPIDRDLENFDSALTVVARRACGDRLESAQDKALQRWFYDSQFQEECFATGAPPGGWAWARPGGWPDLDDSSVALRALLLLGIPPKDPIVERGIEFLRAMQNRDGSWATFVKNSSMPFDRPCPYVTGHVLVALAEAGFTADDPTVSRAVRFLQRSQHRDGSFDAIWFRNATSATASVVEALARLGLQDTATMRGALQWLLAAQDVSGGWGDGLRSLPTVEETSWALIALLSVNRRTPSLDIACERGVSWLLEAQKPDGTWRCTPLGLYFSTLWYSDSFLPVALPLQALGMFQMMRGS